MKPPPVRPARPPRRQVDGVLLLDKPSGLSSNAALQRARRLYAAAKAGHTGTLDPLASGLLPLCFGDATKFAQSLLDARKAYVATIRFGVATTTGDAEGEVVAERPVAFDAAALAAALAGFVGTIAQVPPAYAALKYQGRNYYEYARAGIAIPRVARAVEIDALELVAWTPPTAVVRVACGKGTYVRVLAEDLGAALGSCAHLSALRRTATGPFAVAAATTLEALEALDPDARDALLLPVDAPLVGLPRLDLPAAAVRDLECGRTPAAPAGIAGRRRCYGEDGRFVGVVEAGAGLLTAVRLVRTDVAAGAGSAPSPTAPEGPV
jgi:tRNA pseudouridine55 synthase